VAAPPRQQAGFFDLETGKYLWAATNPDYGEAANTFPTVIHPDKEQLRRLALGWLPHWQQHDGFELDTDGSITPTSSGTARESEANWPFAISETKPT
jgi:hypothetical protein